MDNRHEVSLRNALLESMGAEAIVNQLGDQPGDVPMTFADVSKAKKLLKYAPDTPIETGLKRFVDWLAEYDPV